MKKNSVIILLFLLVGKGTLQAQSNLQPLIERIVLLQVYMGYVKKGYEIARGGWQTVKDITNGEFNLHNSFFQSLKTVSPEVRNYVKVGEIITMQLNMVDIYKKAYRYAAKCDQFTAEELLYLFGIYQRLMEETAKDIDLLALIVTNSKTEMKDDERIDWIDKLYDAVKDKSLFLASLNMDIRTLADSRAQEKSETNRVKKFIQQ